MRYAANSLDYFSLLKAPDRVDGARTVRVAVLAECATQHLVKVMRVLGARNGFNFEIYEGGYDNIALEILNPQSALYAADPHYVVIIMAGEKLKNRLYESTDRSRFCGDTVAALEDLWSTLRQHSSATIIQTNFVLPCERAFGNYELKVPDSVGSIFADINYRMAEKARGARNVLLGDVDFLAASVGRAQWADPRLWTMAKVPCRLELLPRLAQCFVDTILAAAGQFTKCVVLDLDNTLWGGVIGDDGVDGIALGDFDEGEAFVAFQKFIRELKRRGIILAVVSKNDHAAAILPFRDHPDMVIREDDIAVFVANWDNKADNIRLVQETLNIGFDSLVFLDDNPFERNIVREFVPGVVVPELPDDPSMFIHALAKLNLFETASYSDADRGRADQYRQEAQRALVAERFTNVDDYLASLNMEIRLERFNAFNLPRIAQLAQRSNQFNLTTRRYGEAACEAMTRDSAVVPLTIRLADKFGDYGLISVIILKHAGQDIEIDEYLMSCRVLKRGVEQFAMNTIFAYAARSGVRRVVGRYMRTAKNDMVSGFYAGFGFHKVSEDGAGGTGWALAVADYEPRAVFMTPILNDLQETAHADR